MIKVFLKIIAWAKGVMVNIIPTIGFWVISAKKDGWGFGIINEDGSWDLDLAERYAKALYAAGCRAWRVLPYLLKDDKSSGNVVLGQNNFLPWIYDGMRFDLSKFNPLYFDGLRGFAEVLNRNGIALIFDLVDNCHGPANEGPWKKNVQGITEWYGFGAAVQAYIKKVVSTLKGLDVYYEVQNEPPIDHAHSPALFVGFYRSVAKLLTTLGVAKNRYWSGAEFCPLSRRSFKEWYDQPKGDQPGMSIDRRTQPSVMHNFGEAEFEYLSFPGRYQVDDPDDARLWFLSDDGAKPRRTRAQNKTFWGKVFKAMPILQKTRCFIESCPHSYSKDPNQWPVLFYAVAGIAEAAGLPVSIIGWEKPEPVEPEPLPPAPPPEPPTPEPEKPTEENMKYINLFGPKKKTFPWVNIRFGQWFAQLPDIARAWRDTALMIGIIGLVALALWGLLAWIF